MPINIEESLQMVIDTATLHEVVSPYLHKVMPNITQKFIRIRKSQRPIELLSLVKREVDRKRPVIVFSNKKSTSDYISIFLNDHDIEAVSMNKSIVEKIRRQQFIKFQSGQVNVLSTTDLASRGLDTKRVIYCFIQIKIIFTLKIVFFSGLSRHQFRFSYLHFGLHSSMWPNRTLYQCNRLQSNEFYKWNA